MKRKGDLMLPYYARVLGKNCIVFPSVAFISHIFNSLIQSNSPRLPKSISKERTFRDTSSDTFLFDKLQELAEQLSRSMNKRGLYAKNVSIKIKTHNFQINTRQSSLDRLVLT